nr:MAG TPA: hypothetical protein [Bacteriophage sp.]
MYDWKNYKKRYYLYRIFCKKNGRCVHTSCPCYYMVVDYHQIWYNITMESQNV